MLLLFTFSFFLKVMLFIYIDIIYLPYLFLYIFGYGEYIKCNIEILLPYLFFINLDMVNI
jgi:hypothetical protein